MSILAVVMAREHSKTPFITTYSLYKDAFKNDVARCNNAAKVMKR